MADSVGADAAIAQGESQDLFQSLLSDLLLQAEDADVLLDTLAIGIALFEKGERLGEDGRPAIRADGPGLVEGSRLAEEDGQVVIGVEDVLAPFVETAVGGDD